MDPQRNGATNHRSLISAQRVVIHGGYFSQHNTSSERKSSFDILQENVAHTAFHNSAARFDPPKCHPNTRVAVLKKIMDWVHRTDWETWYRYILWLTGAADAGKSAISQSIIELCLVEGLVIASFFFFRSDSARNHAKSLIATLAYQIFLSVPSTQETIQAAIDHDPLIFTRSLEHQFDLLIIQPLREFYKPLDTLDEKVRRVIVIDGLDECLDRDSQRQILNILRDAIRKYELPVIFLVASRPEHDIKTVFGSPPMDGMFARLYLDDTYEPDEDIRRFLVDSFEEIKATHPFKSCIPTIWPTPAAVESIVRKSSGQFIYAATVVRYVKSIRHQPHYRLDMILNIRPLQGDMPFAELDALYIMIFSSAADIDKVLFAISVYSLRVASHCYQAFDLLHYMSLDQEELEILFCDLGAIISVEECKYRKATWLRILHASIHDFLLDPMRSKDYFINIDTYRTPHITATLKYISPTHLELEEFDLSEAECRYEHICEFSKENILICDISAELAHQAFCFPLQTILNILQRHALDYSITNFLCFIFLPFVRRMARLSPEWSFIEDHAQNTFDQFFLSHVPFYYNNNSLTALLCLAYHGGQAKYVPSINYGSKSDPRVGYPVDVDFLYTDNNRPIRDALQVAIINTSACWTTEEDQYRQFLIGFLHNPKRSGNYAIVPTTYTQATLVFMERISELFLDWENEGPIPEKDSYLSSHLTFHNNIWTLFAGSSLDYDPDQIVFLCLGYIIFFLPRSGRSQALLEHCKEQAFLTHYVIQCFPERTALVRHAIQVYLERFGRDSPSSGEVAT